MKLFRLFIATIREALEEVDRQRFVKGLPDVERGCLFNIFNNFVPKYKLINNYMKKLLLTFVAVSCLFLLSSCKGEVIRDVYYSLGDSSMNVSYSGASIIPPTDGPVTEVQSQLCKALGISDINAHIKICPRDEAYEKELVNKFNTAVASINPAAEGWKGTYSISIGYSSLVEGQSTPLFNKLASHTWTW